MFYGRNRDKDKPRMWFDSRTSSEKSSDKYFEELEDLTNCIDEIADCAYFDTDLTADDFPGAYQYVMARIKELKSYLRHDYDESDRDDLIESLDEIREDLEDLDIDCALYDDGTDYLDDDDDDDDDDWEDDEDEDWEDNDDDDDFYK